MTFGSFFKKAFKTLKQVSLRIFFYVLILLSMISMILLFLFIFLSGFNLEAILGVLNLHPFWTLIALVIGLFLAFEMPISITAKLVPEPVVSKVATIIGLPFEIASSLTLFVVLLIFSGIGVLVFSLMSIIFLTFALLTRPYVSIKKSLLFRFTGFLSILLGLLFMVLVFTKLSMIVSVILFSIILGIIFIGMGILYFTHDKEKVKV